MSKIETLIVCGDSFQDTGNTDHEGTHWSEIVSDRLNLKLLNLAIKGGSSVSIAFQMLHAEKVPNSLVIGAMAATEARFEITNQLDSYILNTIENFEYTTKKNPWNKEHNPGLHHIRSTPISMLPEELRTQILTHFNFNLKRQTDTWTVLYALGRLKHASIPFLFFQAVSKCQPIPLELFAPFAGRENIILAEEMDPFAEFYDHSKMTLEEIERLDPGYHTTYERQVVIADYMTPRIQNMIQGL